MPTIFPPTQWVELPELESLEVEDPCDADGPVAVLNGINQVMYFRRRAAHHHIEYDQSVLELRFQTPTAVNSLDAPVFFRTQPHDEHLFVSIHYQADERVSAGNAHIDIELRTLAGVALDNPAGGAGIRWSLTTGTLPARHDLEVSSTGFPAEVWPVMRVDTGSFIDAAPAAYPTTPRLLNLGAAGADTWVRLNITPTAVRVLSVDVWAMFREQEDV